MTACADLVVSGFVLCYCGGVCDGHITQRQPCHLHVQHAVRLQHPLQNQASLPHHHEQGRADCVEVAQPSNWHGFSESFGELIRNTEKCVWASASTTTANNNYGH